MDDIIRGHLGALIVIGEPQELQFLFSGGVRLDHPFTPQFLYELAKMDGAIILDSDSSRIVCANVQLMPDPTIPPPRRHPSPHRRARGQADGALVISISQQRDTVTVYRARSATSSRRSPTCWPRRTRRRDARDVPRPAGSGLPRLTALEFQSAVMLEDVLVALQRAELATRMGEEIERNVVELGSEGRADQMQLAELIEAVPRDQAAIVRDYEVPRPRSAPPTCARAPGADGPP